MNKKQRKLLTRIILTVAVMIPVILIPSTGMVRFALYMIPYLIVGYDILKKAIKGILHGQVFDENFLMAIATVGAIVIAINGRGDYTEAVAVMLFYQIGEFFQSYAVSKSRKSINDLMDIRPDYANVETDGKLEKTDPESVQIGTVITVLPGEKIPIDGIIEEGESYLDTVMMTGESMPRFVRSGDEVVSGCINQSSMLKIKTTKEFFDSTVSKILDLVENASSKKSRCEGFISRFAAVYTPAVCISALLLAVIPPVVNLILNFSPNIGEWIYRALTFLVISCPCALVISIPLTFFAAIGGAGRNGILIKGSNYIEMLSKTNKVVFDKTGTLTKGEFSISEIYSVDGNTDELLKISAHAEFGSTHPIGKCLLKEYGGRINTEAVKDVTEIAGKGVKAVYNGAVVMVGNRELMSQVNIEPLNTSHIGTIVHVAYNEKYLGYIVISDIVKPESVTAIGLLKKTGIEETVMLTGDIRPIADKVANELCIDKYECGLLPSDKVEHVEKLINGNSKGKTLAFVGDGINDAPVLARADIGIAMGGVGSDSAIEAADIVIMDDDPIKISTTLSTSKKCMGIVYENIVFALSIKIICLILGACGIANMWLAIFSDVGVMVLAVLNAIRAMNIKSKN